MNKRSVARICAWLCLIMTAGAPQAAPPQRVVSINLCTDQLLLMLADPGQIASVSYLALEPDSSFVADRAAAYPVNHARIEELIRLEPDLILTAGSTDPRLATMIERLGLRLERFPLSRSLDTIEENIRHMARLLGHPQRGEAMVADLEREIAAASVPADAPRGKALFYQPRGYTSGSDTLQDQALRLAGWRNLAVEAGVQGYGEIGLEQLLLARPDRIFTSSYSDANDSLAERRLDHPALARITGGRPLVEVAYKYWICGGPMISEAIAALRAAHRGGGLDNQTDTAD